MVVMSNWELLPAQPPMRPALTAQQAAVVADPGRIVVTVGGPGTGKTLVMVESVVARVAAGVPLERLVVLTSSRSRAQDLRRQITRRLGGAQISPRVTTVHGFALGLLREEPESDWRLLRAPEQELRLRELLAGLPEGFWPEEYREAAGTRAFARQLREFLARARQRSLDPDQIAEVDPHNPLLRAVARFAEEYLTVADFERTLDYAELIHRARLLITQPEAARSLSARFEAVYADDVQEQDPAQALFLGDLALVGLRLRAFGDPHQRISAFRGATAEALSLLERLPDARRRELQEGFRMSASITRAVGSLQNRLTAVGAPPLPQSTTEERGRLRVQILDDGSQELAHVAAQIRAAHHREGVAWHEMAIVVRTGRAQLLPVVRAMTSFGIPVEVTGDELPIAEQHSVRSLLEALRTLIQEEPPAPAARIDLMAGPLAGLDATSRRRLGRQLIARHDGSATDLLQRSLTDPALLEGIDLPEARRLARLAHVLKEARRLVGEQARVGEVLWQLWDGTPWPGQLREAALEGARTAHHELDAVIQLFDLAERHNSLVGAAGIATFIGEVLGQDITADTAREVDLAGRGVRIVTAHRARDGEWDRVWVVGLQEGTWPRGRPADALIDPALLDGGPADIITHLADERRLFHVACSRARLELTVTASAPPDPEASPPSRFIHELGVVPQRISGPPSVRLTAAELISELRRHAQDETASPQLRRAAALRLARLSTTPTFTGADPTTWWGNRHPSGKAAPLQDPIRLSGSSLDNLLTCPRRWFLTRRAGADTPSNVGASVGEVIHAILARGDELDLDADAMIGHLDQVWERLEFPTAWLSGTERAQMEQVIRRFAAWRESNPHRLLAVEHDFAVTLEVTGRPVQLRGTVDRLEEADGALRVVDYKTGRSLPTRREVQTDPQLGVYQLAATLGAFDHLLPDRSVAPASLLMLRHGGSLPQELVQPAIQEAGDGETGPTWVHDLLAEAVAILDSGTYEARAGRYCQWCPLRHSCPTQEVIEVDE